MRKVFIVVLLLLTLTPLLAQDTPAETWAVRLTPGTDPNAAAAQLGLQNLGQIGSLENYYLFRAPSISARVQSAQTLATLPGVVEVLPQIPRDRYPRVITDPTYLNQWHLNNTGQNGGLSGEDINVIGAWDAGFTGTGIVLAAVDDGLYETHPDIAPNYRADVSWDYVSEEADPTGGNFDTHGTSVAGTMAAAADGSACGVGVAYNAQIAGRRIPFFGQTDAQEARALSEDNNIIYVFNNSWGPSDNGAVLDEPGALTKAALLDGATNGRDGKGSIFVWAAGNGRASADNANADGYASSIYVISVAATNNRGQSPWYSERGAPILVSAPGGAASSTGNISTTGAPTGCTSTFAGTSAAAPVAAGAIALMLQANPTLTWRDVQHILVNTAEKNDPANADWTTNGAGYPINHNYGFGRIDASAAVTMAQTWQNVPAMITYTSPVMTVNSALPATSTIQVPENFVVEHVEVVLNAAHARRGEITATLTSPAGTQSNLMEARPNDSSNAGFNNWRMSSVRHWGEESGGVWQLQLQDAVANASTGSFQSWQLIVHGYNRNGMELLGNRSFENGLKRWSTIQTSFYSVHDGVVFSNARTGLAALRVVGDLNEKTMFTQVVRLKYLDMMAAGDTLTLSAYVKTRRLTSGADVQMVARYADDTPTKLRLPVPTGTMPYTLLQGTVTLKDQPVKVVARVRYINKLAAGRMFVDDVSLFHKPAEEENTRQWLPLPPAP